MRVKVISDADGNIGTVIWAPEDGPGLSVPVPPGHEEMTLDVPELPADLDERQFARRFMELRERYRVDVAARKVVRR